MQTYMIFDYPDFATGKLNKYTVRMASNVDNLRKNLIKESTNAIYTIVKRNTSTVDTLGDLSIGKAYGKKVAAWRKPFSGDDWHDVDTATGKIKSRLEQGRLR